MNHNSKLQFVLEVIKNSDNLTIEIEEFWSKLPPDVDVIRDELINELIGLKYISEDWIPKGTTGGRVKVYKLLSKGNQFIKDGGFRRRRIFNSIRLIGGIIIFIVTVWTFGITLKDCSKVEEESNKSSQSDSLNLHKVESYHKTVPITKDSSIVKH